MCNYKLEDKKSREEEENFEKEKKRVRKEERRKERNRIYWDTLGRI